MAPPLESNVKLLVLKQGISTSDDLGVFHTSFNPLPQTQPSATGSRLTDPTPEELGFLRQSKLESITFLVCIKPLAFHPGGENLRVVCCNVATTFPSSKTIAQHLAASIVIEDLKVRFRCSEKLMKAHVTPMDQQTHGQLFKVIIRLSQSECVVNWTISRQVSLPVITTNGEIRSCSFRSSTQSCLVN